MGLTVTQLAYAFGGSNPSLPTSSYLLIAEVAQSGSSSVDRALAFQAEGRGFESRLPLDKRIHLSDVSSFLLWKSQNNRCPDGEIHNFPAKYLFIRGGFIDRNVYFIEKGLTRSYCLVDGKEHTTWFSKEGDITFGLLCLYHNKAGFEFVETVEPTLAYSVPIHVLNELYDTNIEIANWGRVIHQECLLALQCVRIDNLTMTAKERYEALLKTFPDICQRVNLGYIASFLGISISTLSRIRAEL